MYVSYQGALYDAPKPSDTRSILDRTAPDMTEVEDIGYVKRRDLLGKKKMTRSDGARLAAHCKRRDIAQPPLRQKYLAQKHKRKSITLNGALNGMERAGPHSLPVLPAKRNDVMRGQKGRNTQRSTAARHDALSTERPAAECFAHGAECLARSERRRDDCCERSECNQRD